MFQVVVNKKGDACSLASLPSRTDGKSMRVILRG